MVLLWEWNRLFPVLQTEDWGVSGEASRQKVRESRYSSPHILFSFGFSGDRVTDCKSQFRKSLLTYKLLEVGKIKLQDASF